VPPTYNAFPSASLLLPPALPPCEASCRLRGGGSGRGAGGGREGGGREGGGGKEEEQEKEEEEEEAVRQGLAWGQRERGADAPVNVRHDDSGVGREHKFAHARLSERAGVRLLLLWNAKAAAAVERSDRTVRPFARECSPSSRSGAATLGAPRQPFAREPRGSLKRERATRSLCSPTCCSPT
jgi:hypothetical protein